MQCSRLRKVLRKHQQLRKEFFAGRSLNASLQGKVEELERELEKLGGIISQLYNKVRGGSRGSR